MNFFAQSGADIPKIAIFLLFFSLVALVAEIFYFRRRRTHGEQGTTEVVSLTSPAQVEEVAPKKRSLGKKKVIIAGLLFIALLLPVSFYVVSQPVKTGKEAAQIAQVPAQLEYACDQIDILKNNAIVDPQALSAGDMVRFDGYCFAQGSGQPTVTTFRFLLTNPRGVATNPVFYTASPAVEKSTVGKQYFRSSYPNVRLRESGTYTIQVWAYDGQAALTAEPFTRTFTIGGGSVVPTPTIVTKQANLPPSCTSLSAIPLTGPSPLTVSFTGGGTDIDGRVSAFEFTFGDGAKQTVSLVSAQGTASTSHVYQAAGTYTATLRVQDNSGNMSQSSALCSTQITVSLGLSATTSAQLKAQPTRVASPVPTQVKLPEAGISLPLVGFISGGFVLLTLGLLLTF